jgi:hypothetical protein
MLSEALQQSIFTRADYTAYIASAVALFAAIGSLFASWRSNKNSRRQLMLQLQHTSEQRDRDRAMSLRRDVYVPAVEAIVRSQGALGRTINPDSDLGEVAAQLTADQAAMAKIHLVGSQKTVTALMNYINTLMPAYMELAAMRIPITGHRRAINVEQSIIDRSQATQHQNLELMRQFNLAGKTDQAEWERLKSQFEAEQATIQQHENRKAALWGDHNKAMQQALARMTELAAKVASLIPPAVIAAREELELPIDAEAYRKIFEEQQKLVQPAMQKFVDSVIPPPRGKA